MKRTISLLVLLGAAFVSAQQQQPNAAAGRGQGGGRGGNQNAPAIPNLSQRPSGSSLGTIRVGAADNTIWFGWRVAIPAAEFKQTTFSDALPKSDTLGVTGIEMNNTQRTAFEVPKPFDYRLQAGERNAVVRKLREYNQTIHAYKIENIGDAATQRKYFEFAKAVNVPLIVTKGDSASLDKLADEFAIDVAIEAKDSKAALAAVEGRGRRIGVAIDGGEWLREGAKPGDGLAQIHDRLM